MISSATRTQPRTWAWFSTIFIALPKLKFTIRSKPGSRISLQTCNWLYQGRPNLRFRWVTELDANDLRFTLEEGIDYLRRSQPELSLVYDDLARLVKRTEGWAAGLTLTALALGRQANQRQFVDTFSGAHIYMREYFMEAVRACQP